MFRFQLRKWLFRILALCALLLAIYLFRAPILSTAAKLWIVNDPLEKADAIVVLGGGLENRPLEAAKLYAKGLAPKVLVLNVCSNRTDQMGITIPETELAIYILLKNDVPEEAITVVGHGVANTHDECIAIRHWAEDNKPKRLLLPTEQFHTRRVKWFFRKILRESGTEVRTTPVASPDYSASDWWRHEKGLLAFQNELIKFAYYLVKY